jgi:hypothetical protein
LQFASVTASNKNNDELLLETEQRSVMFICFAGFEWVSAGLVFTHL